jgi:hypothetical protein
MAVAGVCSQIGEFGGKAPSAFQHLGEVHNFDPTANIKLCAVLNPRILLNPGDKSDPYPYFVTTRSDVIIDGDGRVIKNRYGPLSL